MEIQEMEDSTEVTVMEVRMETEASMEMEVKMETVDSMEETEMEDSTEEMEMEDSTEETEMEASMEETEMEVKLVAEAANSADSKAAFPSSPATPTRSLP